MIVFPNAKINLGLNVERRRADGYHDICTVMAPVGWRDILEIVPARGAESTLTVTGRAVDCPPERNLVMRAMRALAESVGGLPPVDIYLRKVIPDGAGLGGGSADAAFTVAALNDLFGLGLGLADMAAVASRVGSDCPFFIYNRPMLCTGTGTTMEPFELPPLGDDLLLAIVKPPQSVSTAAAYAGVRPAVAVPPVPEAVSAGLDRWAQLLRNDFEPSVEAVCPEVTMVKNALERLNPLYCSMSGSGSAVYALFGTANMSDDMLRREIDGFDADWSCHVDRIGEGWQIG